MQEAFEEFARLVGSGQATANNLLTRLLRNQLKEELASVGLKPFSPNRKKLRDVDSDRLYDLINEDALDDPEAR